MSEEDNAQNSEFSSNYLEVREKWDQLLDISSQKKRKLEQAQEQATVLNNAMGDTADWLIEAEESLGALVSTQITFKTFRIFR